MLAGGSGGKQVVASTRTAKKVPRPKKRKSIYEHKTTVYLMGIRTAQPAELGPAVLA